MEYVSAAKALSAVQRSGSKYTIRLPEVQRKSLEQLAREMAVRCETDVHGFHIVQALLIKHCGVASTDPTSTAVAALLIRGN